MIVSAIVAQSKNRVIGKDNQIPWYLPADLKYFKKTTINHPIVMGRKTFQSIGRPLPKRTNIVLTKDAFFVASGCLIAHSIKDALEIAFDQDAEEVFIIGGGIIYEQSMLHLDKIYVTEVEIEVPGDAFFPALDEREWREVSATSYQPDEKNEFAYTFKVYERQSTN